MTITFFGPAEPDLNIPYEWPVHNVAEVMADGREVQVTVGKRTYKLATVVHYGENGRFIKYVISDNGWFALFRTHPEYSRLAYVGMQVK